MSNSKPQALLQVLVPLTVVLTILLVLIHALIRVEAKSWKHWSWSDRLVSLALVAATPFWTLLCIGLYYDLDATMGDADERKKKLVVQIFFWSQVPRLVSTGVAKCSFALFAYDVKGVCNKSWKMASFFSLGVMGLWTLGAPMIATVGCTPSVTGAWSPCPTTATRWVAITAGEVSSDVGLVVLCVSIPWTTGGVACRHKLAASAIFSFRLVLPIFTICRCLAFESFLKHGRSNADLASTIAFDCCLTMLAIFTLVLPAITKIPVSILPAIKKMLERVKPASQADQNQEDGEPSTVPWKRQHAPSSVLSLPADPLRSSVLQSKTPPPRPARPARPLSPSSFAPLPRVHMQRYRQTTDPYGGQRIPSVGASMTEVSLCEMQSFSSKEGILGAGRDV